MHHVATGQNEMSSGMDIRVAPSNSVLDRLQPPREGEIGIRNPQTKYALLVVDQMM